MLSKLKLSAISRKKERSNAEVISYNTHLLHELHKQRLPDGMKMKIFYILVFEFVSI